MPKKIDSDAVKHVALLARLLLNEGQLELYSSQLGSILAYINKLNEIDTKNVQPTCHALSTLKNVFRKDKPKGSLPVEDVLRNAPSKEGDFFKVPQIIEGK